MLGLLAALTLAFSSYGPSFSTESAIAPPIDPQVFVKDGTAQAAIGPQSIAHDKGYRPALLTSDPPDVPLFNANGAPLGITLGRWVGANGTLDITPLNKDAETVTVRLSGLSPYGVYSVFVIAAPQWNELSPIDGTGAGNTLQADVGGSATTSMLVSPQIAPGSSVVVIFHSDGASHGPSPGAPGVTSHAQLIASVPK
jgi:hypothetical protein